MRRMYVLFLVLFSATIANAETISSSLQAVITSPLYSKALEQARLEVKAYGNSYQLTLGKTSTLELLSPSYYFYLPVYAVKMPLSTAEAVNVGSIVVKLLPALNAPLPDVESVYFAPAPVLAEGPQ